MNLRLMAARIIDDVTNGCSLLDVLSSSLTSLKDARDRAFVQAVCYGVCRFYSRLDVVLSQLLKKPMKAKDSIVHALLCVGLYQLMDMRVPPHAAVDETVKAADKLNQPWARGLVNAILREYLRHKAKIDETIQADPESEYAHPLWWISSIKKVWPAHWQAILQANNAYPPFALRVNQRRMTREQYLEKLQASELTAHIISETQMGIILDSPMAVETLPGFSAGEVSVQDGAAQLAAELLDVHAGQRVLDACAAPGGKLTHILEREAHLAACIAIEKEAARMSSIKENLTRLQLQAQCICDDAGEVKGWWDGQLFDRILLDAPCSASGVIRRHPDIKLLRQPQDIGAMAKQQARLLESLWPLLKPGGMLVYATCSIFPEENVGVMQAFLAAHPEAQEEPILAEWGVMCEVGRQILPGMCEMDGFYYARVKKSN
ncbi:MAG: 16S rRNA (cytosine(967)-C(5))-methyltransferase RsmB [Gammaproteobacteria bacterium]|nr:MAG: 16S rRNA (cytosine(967)-C(5))-methyltransferase RsmB [Gammaproteobacteria bacterium]